MEAITSKPGLFDDLVEELPPAVSDQTFLEAQARLAQQVASGARKLPRRKGPARTPQQKLESFLKGEATRRANLSKAFATWVAANQPEYEWLLSRQDRSSFAASLLSSLREYGRLTDGQMAAVTRCRTEDEARAAAQKSAPAVCAGDGLNALHVAFGAARGAGVKIPKLRCGELVFSLAGEASKNPGCIYVKSFGEYVGKITPTGQFHGIFSCTSETQEEVKAAMRDPKAQAIKHGRETGSCSVCGRELTDPVSIEAGIGPICAGRMGW